jgi:RNA polymerase sigma-70 factor (ECF subfamily)
MNGERPAEDRKLPNPETWLEDHGNYLFRYALVRLRDREIAEDVVQETFLAALQVRENFEGRSSVRTWLTGILKHKIMDHLRKKSREQPTDNTESLPESPAGLFDDMGHWRVRPAKWSTNPAKVFEQKEFWKIFHGCLSELPTRLAQAFMLREMDGLSSQEICNVLNISATNSWVMLYRARMHLRRCLEINWFNAKTDEGS